MNQITNLFRQKNDEKLLSIYFTAGFPQLEDTNTILKALQDSGVDLVEIGMPFSDPLADGPTIQASGQQALKNGMNLKTLFEQLKNRDPEIRLPLILMGYLNPILQFGMEDFLRHCQEAGIAGLIIPDLPLPVYEKEYKTLFQEHDIDFILLVTPETSEERLHQIDKLGSGFIYAVSSSSTTGTDKDWKKQEEYFKKLKNSKLRLPVLAGFGVKDNASYKAASIHTSGAIIGTAFIKALQQEGALETRISNFIKRIKTP